MLAKLLRLAGASAPRLRRAEPPVPCDSQREFCVRVALRNELAIVSIDAKYPEVAVKKPTPR